MYDQQGVSTAIVFAEEIEETKEVNEGAWGGVHEDHCKHDYVKGVHISIAERIVSAISTSKTYFSVFLVSEVGIHYFRKYVA